MAFAGIIRDGQRAAQPDRCVCCGQQRRPMATTGVTVPGWGVIHVCVGTTLQPGCLLQAARDAGCLMPAEARLLVEEIEKLEANVKALTAALHRKPTESVEDPVVVVSVDEVESWLEEKLGVPPQAKKPRAKAATGGPK